MTPSYTEFRRFRSVYDAALWSVHSFCAAMTESKSPKVMSVYAVVDSATLAKCRCGEARAGKRTLYHGAGVVGTWHFTKIRVSQGNRRSKLNRRGGCSDGKFKN